MAVEPRLCVRPPVLGGAGVVLSPVQGGADVVWMEACLRSPVQGKTDVVWMASAADGWDVQPDDAAG